jgi:CheY-like chemotaxis protein
MFYLNSVPPEHTSRGKKSTFPEKDSSEVPPGRKKLLIAEDEALVAENLREFAEKAGYRVIAVVSTGEEAVERITKNPADLILMDVRLAGRLTGVEVIQLIHQNIKEIPVIFLSAYTEDLFPEVSSISPALYRYISKPYKEEDLESIIRELLT